MKGGGEQSSGSSQNPNNHSHLPKEINNQAPSRTRVSLLREQHLITPLSTHANRGAGPGERRHRSRPPARKRGCLARFLLLPQGKLGLGVLPAFQGSPECSPRPGRAGSPQDTVDAPEPSWNGALVSIRTWCISHPKTSRGSCLLPDLLQLSFPEPELKTVRLQTLS